MSNSIVQTKEGYYRSSTLIQIEQDLTCELQRQFDDASGRAVAILSKPLSIHQFHAIIGCRNNDFVDAVRTQFSDPDDFWSRWLRGFRLKLESDRLSDIRKYGRVRSNKSVFRLKRILDDPVVLEYTRLFLIRNFYRQVRERTRAKPDEFLWELWFGGGRGPWGLIIAPAHREGNWTNDKSEMRRADYDYWTIGHLLCEGLVTPESNDRFRFKDFNDLEQFYSLVLSRESTSPHEKNVAQAYVDYLKKSPDLDREPFLIPELRYAGKDKKHRFRLDFAILNPHTMDFVGIELSPHSTHGRLTGIKSKTQVKINAELSVQWEHEMQKRNEYFNTFGITTLTFTDRLLANPEEVFNRICEFLARRPEDTIVVADELDAIRNLPLS